MSSLDAAAARMARYRESPIAFVREQLLVEPDPWQLELLDAARTHKRIAACACKGPGKSAAMAWLGWWFLACFQHSKVPCTSITGPNLADGLWTEFAKWRPKSELLRQQFRWSKTRISAVASPETWFATARQWAKDADPTQQANTLAGIRADHLLFLIDEVSDIPDGVVQAAEGALTSGVKTMLYMAGNPTRTEGPLYRAVTSDAHLYKVVRITGDPDDPKRSPRIDINEARAQINRYGRESYVVKVNILGAFPDRQADKLIDLKDCELAVARSALESAFINAPRLVGLDPARFGDDASVLCMRQGPLVYPMKEYRGLDTVELAERAVAVVEKWEADALFIDGTGVGAGVVDNVRRLGFGDLVHEVNFGMRATDPERFENKRAEMYWEAAEWLRKQGCLPRDQLLSEELSAPIYWYDRKQRVCLQPKPEIKARLGRSPDRSDSLVTTFAAPVRSRRREERNPFAGAGSHRDRARTKTTHSRRARNGRTATQGKAVDAGRAASRSRREVQQSRLTGRRTGRRRGLSEGRREDRRAGEARGDHRDLHARAEGLLRECAEVRLLHLARRGEGRSRRAPRDDGLVLPEQAEHSGPVQSKQAARRPGRAQRRRPRSLRARPVPLPRRAGPKGLLPHRPVRLDRPWGAAMIPGLQVASSERAGENLRLRRQAYCQRWAALKMERSSWDPHWQDLGQNFRPRRYRAEGSSDQKNAGSRRNGNIINSTPVNAAGILSSGMMAGITSPSRPWFRLSLPDADLASHGPVRLWLSLCEERIRLTFAKSNIYKAFQEVYDDLGIFGTPVLFIDEDPEDIIRAYTFPVGQFALANSDTLRVDTLYRQTNLSVRQLVRKFGLENVSQPIRDAYKKGQVDGLHSVLHLIEPNEDFLPGRIGPAGKPFRACWLELSSSDEKRGLLREGGYNEQPFMAPRWRTTSEDVYGHSPAMNVLGDARALQLLEKKKLLAVEKLIDPPMTAPASLKQSGRPSLIPGDITWLPDGANPGKFEPAHTVSYQAVQVTELSVREHENRIKEALFVDLFKMLSDSDRRTITAREINERHEEKMEQLGPVLENLQDELLDPVIERAFNILWRRGELPPPPPEVQGETIRIQHVSILAQAQRMFEAQPIERVASFVVQLASVAPEALDTFNVEVAVRELGDLAGLKPSLLRSAEEVAKLQQSRAQAQQQQQQAEQALAATEGVRNLGSVTTGEETALGALSRAVRDGGLA